MHFHSLHNSASDVPRLPCSLTPCFLLPLTSPLPDEFILLKDLYNQMSFLPLMLSLQLWILSTNLLLVSVVFYFPCSPQESSSPLPFLPSVSSPCCLFCPVTPLFCVTDCWMWFFILPVGPVHTLSHLLVSSTPVLRQHLVFGMSLTPPSIFSSISVGQPRLETRELSYSFSFILSLNSLI